MNVKLTPVVIGMALAFLAFIIGAFTLLAATGKDTQGIVTLLSATIFPAVLGLFNLARQEKTAEVVKQVATNVNGNTGALLDQVATLVDHLAAAPVTPELRAAMAKSRGDLEAAGRHAAPVPAEDNRGA